MMMKKWMLLMVAVCLLLAGCSKSEQNADTDTTTETVEEANQSASENAGQDEAAVVVYPLPDATMENLTDAILAVSLEEGDAYVDDTGKMQMDVKIYTYDKYDMVDIANLKEGDTIVTHAGEVVVTSLERTQGGLILINGGLEEGGFDLFTDDSGIFYESGYNDVKNWYEVGAATIRVSADFEGRDNSNPDQGEVVLYPGSFLVGEVTDYNFTPYNTTIRVEGGQIVEMNRMYTP
jgi:uncharacterized protein YcfL